MAAERLNLVSLPGRFISGSITDKQTTDYQNQPIPADKQGFMIGIAIRKDAVDTNRPNASGQPYSVNDLIGEIYGHALKGYQTNGIVAQQIQRGFDGDFSWKIKDGDKPNAQGVIGEHGKGCWIFYMSTTLPIKACDNRNVEMDPKGIKRGYYIDIAFNCSINEQLGDRAGIYLNPSIVRLLGYGDEIHSGPTPQQAFANAPASLPAGASATPVAPSGGMPQGGGMPGQMPQGGGMPGQMPQGGGMPGQMPQGGGMPGQMPQGGGMPGQMPQGGGYPQGVQPHHGFVQGAGVQGGYPQQGYQPQGGGMPGMGNG